MQSTLFPIDLSILDEENDDDQDRCEICGKKLVRNHIEFDKRDINGTLRCFDHIGVL
jgi:hypothetical protein